MTLAAGDKAPDFTLPTDGNGSVTLSSLQGEAVILLFLPQGRHHRLHRPKPAVSATPKPISRAPRPR